jgi:hypothetical protein
LTGAAGNHVLVTLSATLGVVGGTESVLNRFYFLENETIVIERATRNDVIRIQRFERRSLLNKSVRQVVKTRRRLGGVTFRIINCRPIFGGDRAVVAKSFCTTLACLREDAVILQNGESDKRSE